MSKFVLMCKCHTVTVWKCISIINALSYFVSCQQHLRVSCHCLIQPKRCDSLGWNKRVLSLCCSCPTQIRTRCSPSSTSLTSSVWCQVKTPSTRHDSSCFRSSTGLEWGPSTRTSPDTLWWVMRQWQPDIIMVWNLCFCLHVRLTMWNR